MSGFDYRYTCPKIDKAIAEARDNITAEVDNILDEACPLLPRAVRGELSTGYADSIYKSIEDCFESVRDTNEDMRKEAEHQIRALQSELADAKSEIAELERAAA